MSDGKWYLVYTYFNEMESMGNEIENVEVSLSAIIEADAIVEAKAKWEEIAKKANAYWEKQKATWFHPPKSPFHDVSPRPRIIYRIFL